MGNLMLVIEGPDCVGKTTLIQALADHYSCEVTKRIRTKDRYTMMSNIFNDIDRQMLAYQCGGSSRSVSIYDRWQLVSDPLYEKYCYRRSSILEPFYPFLAKKFQEANILVLYLTMDLDDLLARFDERGDALRSREELIRIHDAYEQMFEIFGMGYNLPHERLDVTGFSREALVEKVISMIDMAMAAD